MKSGRLSGCGSVRDSMMREAKYGIGKMVMMRRKVVITEGMRDFFEMRSNAKKLLKIVVRYLSMLELLY